MAKRKNRSPEQILADLEEQRKKQLAKLASSTLRGREDTAALASALEEVRKQITVARRGFSNGPQSFDMRIAKHHAWIDKIEAEKANAEDTISELEAERDRLNAAFAEISALVAEDPTGDYTPQVQAVFNTQVLEA